MPTGQDSIEANSMLSQIDACFQEGNFTEVLSNCKRLQKLAKTTQWWEMYATAKVQECEAFIRSDRKEDFKFCLTALDTFLQSHRRDLGQAYKRFWLESYYGWGTYYESIGMYDQAIIRFQNIADTLATRDSLSGFEQIKACGAVQYIAAIEEAMGDYETAIHHYLEALEYLKIPGDYPSRFITSYSHVAQIYKKQRQYATALDYFRKAFEVLEKSADKIPQAVEYQVRMHFHLANFYLETAQPDSALQVLQRGENFITSKTINRFAPDIYITYGRIYTQQFKYQATEEAFNRAIRLRGSNRNHYTVPVYIALGKMWVQRKNYYKALGAYQNALYHLSTSFQPLDLTDNPTLQEVYLKQELLQVLQLKAESCYQLHLSDEPDLAWLQQAWRNAEMALMLIDSVRLDYSSEADKQFLVGNSYPIFEQAIYYSYLLFDYTQHVKYKDFAFLASERSKALILNEAVGRTQSIEYSGLSQQYREQILLLQSQLRGLEEQFYEAQTDPRPNQALIRDLQVQLYQQREDLKTYIDQLEEANATFAQYNSAKQSSTVAEAQALLDDQTSLVEYFEGEQHVFVFVLANDDSQFFCLRKNASLAIQVEKLRKTLYLKLETYANLANELYGQIWQPIESSLKTRVVIVPDGVLNYLPFEALLTKMPENIERPNTFAYLLYDYQFSYAYSAALLKKMKNYVREGSGKILAFAPSFPENKELTTNDLALRSSFGPLKHNDYEVGEIMREVSGKSFYKKRASWERFRRLAPLYQFIHLSTHGKANDQRGTQSMLAFRSGSDIDTCHVFQLYDLKLQAEMVVLSACETGIGELQHGEGIIGLSRGFIVAGAASLITTLWSVNDRPSADLMVNFYRFLKKGLPKDAALQAAKKELIENSDFAHPFYWAGFIANGNMRPVELKDAPNWWCILGISVLGIFIFIGFFLQKKLRNSFSGLLAKLSLF